MELYPLIYNTIVDIWGKEHNKIYNQNILDIFLEPFNNDNKKNYDWNFYKEQLALSSLRTTVDDNISDKLVEWLCDLRDNNKHISSNLIVWLGSAYYANHNWNNIINSTRDLSLLFNEEELFKNINPNIIKKELKNKWINHVSYLTEGWIVHKNNVNIYVKEVLIPYTINDLDMGKEHKYKIFDISKNWTIEPRIFLITVNKKSRNISYHSYDPDDKEYESTIKQLLRNNFIFSIRNDV